MFSQTFVDGTQQTRKPYTVALSLLLQIAAICLLILVPLLYTQALPSAQLKSMLTAPPPPPSVPKAPPVGMRKVGVTRTLQLPKLVAPSVIPKHIAMINEAPAAPDIGLGATAPDGAAGNNALLFGSPGENLRSAPPPPPPTKPKGSGPIRVGGIVAEANVVRRVQPVYPGLARSARVQGTVEFTAVISKEGRVENLQLVRGHPLLVNAARDAILQWQYRPTMLNGQAVEVLTTITVNFTLAN